MDSKALSNPSYVNEVFRHVRSRVPNVSSVLITRDSWLFLGDDGKAPSFFGVDINTSLLEAMLSQAYNHFNLPVTFDYKPEEDFVEGTIYVVYWDGQAVSGFDWYTKAEGAIKNYRTSLETGCSATLIEHALPEPVLYGNMVDYLDDITGIKNSSASYVIAEKRNGRVGVMIVSGAGDERPCYAQYDPIEGRSFVDEWNVLADQCYTYYTSDEYESCNMISMCINMMCGKGWVIEVSKVDEDLGIC